MGDAGKDLRRVDWLWCAQVLAGKGEEARVAKGCWERREERAE